MPVTVDFETEGIQDRPAYPPVPVGVSIKYPGKAAKYYAWGHPTENNCTKEQAGDALKEAWRSTKGLLFQNAKFDLEVAEKFFGLHLPPADKWDDTMFLLFLNDPHAKTLSLKPSSETLLGIPPDEQDAVKDWVLTHVPGAKEGDWGAYISKAPGKLVGKYANGDVVRTEKLYALLMPKIKAAGMADAYMREKKVMPILLRNEQVGIRVDVEALRQDLVRFKEGVEVSEKWLRKALGVGPSMNLDSDIEKADALDKAGIVTTWSSTPTGKRSTAKRNMGYEVFNDKKVFQALSYRDRMCTCIRMFGENWLAMASAGDGHIHTNWNQVRQGDNRERAGTRTGRPSTSNPNFLNISKAWTGKDDHYEHPSFIKGLPELPLMRAYLLPDKGQIFLHRDYSQQELRVAAHYEDGPLLAAYNANPSLDLHAFVSAEVERVRGTPLSRGQAKIAMFRKLYGGGVAATAQGLNISMDAAKQVIAGINSVMPGVQALEREVKRMGEQGAPVKTWGGRLYYAEPAQYSKKYNREMTFYYKLLNYLIQGSSADITKEAMIRYDEQRKEGRFLVAVYDEQNISAPKKAAKSEMKILKETMESIELDLALPSTGKSGLSWGTLTPYKD